MHLLGTIICLRASSRCAQLSSPFRSIASQPERWSARFRNIMASSMLSKAPPAFIKARSIFTKSSSGSAPSSGKQQKHHFASPNYFYSNHNKDIICRLSKQDKMIAKFFKDMYKVLKGRFPYLLAVSPHFFRRNPSLPCFFYFQPRARWPTRPSTSSIAPTISS